MLFFFCLLLSPYILTSDAFLTFSLNVPVGSQVYSSVSVNLLVYYVALEWKREHTTMHSGRFSFLENKYFVLAIYI